MVELLTPGYLASSNQFGMGYQPIVQYPAPVSYAPTVMQKQGPSFTQLGAAALAVLGAIGAHRVSSLKAAVTAAGGDAGKVNFFNNFLKECNPANWGNKSEALIKLKDGGFETVGTSSRLVKNSQGDMLVVRKNIDTLSGETDHNAMSALRGETQAAEKKAAEEAAELAAENETNHVVKADIPLGPFQAFRNWRLGRQIQKNQKELDDFQIAAKTKETHVQELEKIRDRERLELVQNEYAKRALYQRNLIARQEAGKEYLAVLEAELGVGKKAES